MGLVDSFLIALLLAGKCVESGTIRGGKISQVQKNSLVASIISPSNLPKKNQMKCEISQGVSKYRLNVGKYGNILAPLADQVESYRGKLGLDLQLQKVKVYYAVDYTNDAIVSYYPKNEKSEAYKKEKEYYKVKKPNYYVIVKEFLELFTQEKENKKTAKYNMKQLNSDLPNAVVVFMDPNSCADQVVELNKQDKEAKVKTSTLNKIFKLFENQLNFYRDEKTVNILLPISESLIYATNYGGTHFHGTPVFTTDPPVYVREEKLYDKLDKNKKKETQNLDKFNKGDKLVVFFTPSEAKEFYKKVRWNKTYKDPKTGKEYRIWSNSPPFRPTVRVTSLEKVYKKVHSSEPYWGYLMEFVPPTIKLERRTEFMLKESRNWLLVPWYNFRKLWRIVWN